MVLPERNLGPPQQAEGVPIQETGTTPELTSVVDHIRQGVDTTSAPSPLDYAARGWRIFPCHTIERGHWTCEKGIDCQSPGKHPRTRNGVLDASNDQSMIRAWVSRWGDKINWAVATGHESGIIALDVDPRNGGFQSLNEYEENRQDGALPYTCKQVPEVAASTCSLTTRRT